MTPAPPLSIIADVRLAPLVSLVGQVSTDGLWSEAQPAPHAWRGRRRPVTAWEPPLRPARVSWEK